MMSHYGTKKVFPLINDSYLMHELIYDSAHFIFCGHSNVP